MARIFRMTETGRNRGAAKLPRLFFVVDAGLRPARPGQRPGPTRSRSHKIRSHKTRCAWGEEMHRVLMARIFRMTETGRNRGAAKLPRLFLLWTRVFDPRDRVRDPVPQDLIPQNPCAPGARKCTGPDGKNLQDDGNWSEPGRGEVAAPFFCCGRGSSTRETGSETRSHKIRSHKIPVRLARGNA